MATLNPRQLAHDADAPILVVRLLFAAAEDDADVVRLLRGPAIDQETVRLRRAVIYLARLRAGASFPQIARALNRDHSSVNRALDQAWEDFADPSFRRLCQDIYARAHKPVQVSAAA